MSARNKERLWMVFGMSLAAVIARVIGADPMATAIIAGLLFLPKE